MKDKIMNNALEPIIRRANKCIDPDLLFIVTDDNQEPWKIIFLMLIVFKSALMISGSFH